MEYLWYGEDCFYVAVLCRILGIKALNHPEYKLFVRERENEQRTVYEKTLQEVPSSFAMNLRALWFTDFDKN